MKPVADFAIVIPAAGSGKRFGGGDKLQTDLGGLTVLQRSVGLFARSAAVGQIVVVTSVDRFDLYRQQLRPALLGREVKLVEGGRERWESVLLGLAAVDEAIPYVAVHDAARPLTPADLIEAAFQGARDVGGSVPCLPEPATLKRAGADGLVSETVSRAGLYQAQTPQCFRRELLIGAYRKLLAEGRVADVTDDAQVFERVGRPVRATPGSALNVKITTPEDVAMARAILSMLAQEP